MKPLFRTLDLYMHRSCRDLGWILALCYVRAIFSILSAFAKLYQYYDPLQPIISSYDVANVLFTAILYVSVLIIIHLRKTWGIQAVRVLFGIPFIINIMFFVEALILKDSYLIGYNITYVIISGLVFLFTTKSVRLAYYFACSKDGAYEYGLCYHFGSKRYLPTYDAMILYHAIESEVLLYINYKSGSFTQRILKMNQAVDIFNAYLAVACSTTKRSDIIEKVLVLREKLTNICRWSKSVISVNEDSFLNCTYTLRKIYLKNGNSHLAIKYLADSICGSYASIDPNELTSRLIMFFESIKSPEFYDDYYSNKLMPNAALYMN